MADRTSIEWTESTWTPIRARWLEADGANGKPRVGWHCEHVSEGCRNCYAESINRRLGTQLDFKPGHRRNVEIFLDEKMLLAPLRWRRPRRIFVGSMTDLFAGFVPDAMLDKIFAVTALCQHHTFQVLTKRPARMRAYFADPETTWRIVEEILAISDSRMIGNVPSDGFPLPNVWLGTSCEDQPTADARIPELLETPAAIRFVSAEPLLGPIDFERIEASRIVNEVGLTTSHPKQIDALTGWAGHYQSPTVFVARSHKVAQIDWIIVGGESGPSARPVHPDWIRSIRDQCRDAEVAFLLKQHGEFREFDTGCPDIEEIDNGSETADVVLAGAVRPSWITLDGRHIQRRQDLPNDETPCRLIERVGKKAAGRLLDGVTHDGFPEVRHG